MTEIGQDETQIEALEGGNFEVDLLDNNFDLVAHRMGQVAAVYNAWSMVGVYQVASEIAATKVQLEDAAGNEDMVTRYTTLWDMFSVLEVAARQNAEAAHVAIFEEADAEAA